MRVVTVVTVVSVVLAVCAPSCPTDYHGVPEKAGGERGGRDAAMRAMRAMRARRVRRPGRGPTCRKLQPKLQLTKTYKDGTTVWWCVRSSLAQIQCN